MTQLQLSFIPIPGSHHVYLNGVEQRENVDWEDDGTGLLTFLTPMDERSGDKVEVLYAHEGGSLVDLGMLEVVGVSFSFRRTGVNLFVTPTISLISLVPSQSFAISTAFAWTYQGDSRPDLVGLEKTFSDQGGSFHAYTIPEGESDLELAERTLWSNIPSTVTEDLASAMEYKNPTSADHDFGFFGYEPGASNHASSPALGRYWIDPGLSPTNWITGDLDGQTYWPGLGSTPTPTGDGT